MKTQALLTVVALVIATEIVDGYRISTADELITFSKNVNEGTTYEGSTVFLDNDIDFSETTGTFAPIGREISGYYFRGTFDGQGHTINNLTISINDRHAGLFGYSKGMTVKNVVMGASCFVENTYEKTNDSGFFAGIIGECEANLGICVVENSVNMADVTFSGSVKDGTEDKRYSIGGGVYGRFASLNDYDAIMRNCANYGTITQTGTSPTTYLGGLRGGCHGSSSHMCTVENCLNAGSVVFNGTTTVLYIGGLGGKIYLNSISNSASIGMITSNKETNRMGALAGGISEGTTTIINCVWTSEETGMITGYGAIEDGGQANPDTLSSSSSTLNAATLAILNENYGRKWILNSGRHTVEFYVNGALTMSANTTLIQQPDFGGNGGTSSFNGWYSDASCTEEFTTYETSGDLILYGTYGVLHIITFVLNDTAQTQSRQSSGKSIVYPADPVKVGHTFNGWNNTGIIEVPDYDITFTAQWVTNNYTVIFDFANGTIIIETLQYNKDIDFPDELINIGHTFNGWNNTDITVVPDYDITFTAQWEVNNYTVTFDFGNRTISNASLPYNEEIAFPEDPIKTGHTFLGWNPEGISTVPDYDITFTAQWEVNNYTVTFDFGNGTILDETLPYDEEIAFPEDPTKTGYTFIEWNNTDNITVVPDYGITFTAQWVINNYTITFDFGNGTTLNKTLQYNEEITFPEDPTKTGYTFNGWNPKGIFTVPDYDITFTAQWISGELGNWISIVFDRKDISKEEVYEIIEGFGDYDFTIERIETNDDSNTFVIIRFEDVSEAKNFVEVITIGSGYSVIKTIGFTKKPIESLSNMAFPLFFYRFLFPHLLLTLT